MAVKAVLASLDGLPADLAKEYTKKEDGKFYLDVEASDGFALENATALRNALQQERAAVASLRTQVSSYEGLDPAKARDALTKVETMSSWTPEQKVQEKIDSATKQVAERAAAERAQLEERVKRLRTVIEREKVHNAAISAISAAEGDVEVLMPHVISALRLREAGDQFVVEVVGGDGNPRISTSSGSTGNMTIPEFVNELKSKDRFAPLFKGSQATGTGTPPSASSGAPSKPATAKPGVTKILASDQKAINAHVDEIADGRAIVVDG
jgi:hypothetical protein